MRWGCVGKGVGVGEIGDCCSCHRHRNFKAGKTTTANGKAKIVAGSRNAKLKVSFFGPFYGDYWVLDRVEDYGWAIVGEPSGRYLWMLTRQAQPEPQVRAQIEARVKEMRYDWSLVRVTEQG